MLMTNQQTAELTKPCVGSLDNPAADVTPQLAPIFVAPFLVVLPVGRDQFDASLVQSLAQRVGIVAAVGNYTLGLLPRPAFRARNADFVERGFRKLNFCRRGTFQPNSQRKTLTVDQYHPLRALAPLGFTDGSAPFFAGAKLPSKKVSSHLSKPSSSSAPSNARHASSQTPSSSHCVATAASRSKVTGTRPAENRHAAPVCRIHRMPSKHASVRCPRSASVVPPTPRLRKQRPNQFPLLVRQQLLPLAS